MNNINYFLTLIDLLELKNSLILESVLTNSSSESKNNHLITLEENTVDDNMQYFLRYKTEQYELLFSIEDNYYCDFKWGFDYFNNMKDFISFIYALLEGFSQLRILFKNKDIIEPFSYQHFSVNDDYEQIEYYYGINI